LEALKETFNNEQFGILGSCDWFGNSCTA